MKHHRYKISFLLTVLLYATSVASYLHYIKTKHFTVIQKPEEKTVTLSLSKFTPPAPPPAAEPEPEMEELEPDTPEPVVMEKPVVKPKPIVKKIIKKIIPKKIKKKLVKKKIKKRKKRVKKRKVKQRNNITKVSDSSVVRASSAQKNHFFAKIRAKINRAKKYPRMAKRRRVQGTVKVSFTITGSGNVRNISVSGPKVFHKSAKDAVRKAFPISTRDAPISLPTSLNISIRYRIK